jgi:hypothetical protein
MQVGRFVRAFGLFLVLNLASFGAGCGSGGTGEKKEGNVVKEEQRTTHKQVKQDKAAADKAQRGDTKRR